MAHTAFGVRLQDRAKAVREAFPRKIDVTPVGGKNPRLIQVYLGKRPADFGTGFRPNGND